MTAAVSGATGTEWVITPQVTLEQQYLETYDDIETSYIITLPAGTVVPEGQSLVASYVNSGESPRRRPRQLTRRGVQNTWAVYADPYKGAVEVSFDVVGVDGSPVEFSSKFSLNASGLLSFNAPKGHYSIRLSSTPVTLVKEAAGTAEGGIVKHDLKSGGVDNGCYMLTVTTNTRTLAERMIVLSD